MAREDVTTQLLKAISLIDQRELMIRHLPTGRMWQKAFDPTSNIGKLFMGLVGEFFRVGEMVEHISNEIDINQTNDLIISWEKSLGIPSNIFSSSVSLSERRENVKYLLGNFGGVQTIEDFRRVANTFGFNVDIKPATVLYTFPLYFPIYFFSQKSVKYTIVIKNLSSISGRQYFPIYFPYYFTSENTNFMEELFRILAPANVNLLFIRSTDDPTAQVSTFSFNDIGDYIFNDIEEYTFTDIYF